jgi:ATP-dependent Lon protease
MLGAFLVHSPVVKSDPIEVQVSGREKIVPEIGVPSNVDRLSIASQFIDIPHLDDIYKVGTLCKIVDLNAQRSLLIESLSLIEAQDISHPALLTVNIAHRQDELLKPDQLNMANNLKFDVVRCAEKMAQQNHVYKSHLKVVIERAQSDMDATDLSMLVNQVAGLTTTIDPDDEQSLVEERNVIARASRLLALMKRSQSFPSQNERK